MAQQVVNAQGSLYELVARGNKDAYFFQDDTESLFIFRNQYGPQTPFLSELRYDQANSEVQFGRTAEFEITAVGDIIDRPALVIDLPTWLPPRIAEVNRRAIVTDQAGVSYGWTNAIAYFLFERIQLFQDTFLMQEWSGDALWVQDQTLGTYNSSLLQNTATGYHQDTEEGIRRAATPGRLRLALPLIGCGTGGSGFPIRCVTEHKYKIRVKLRKLEDLVEASDRRAKPNPWGRGDFKIERSAAGESESFTTLLYTEVTTPLKIQLETTQKYLLDDARAHLMRQTIKLPFQQFYENVYSQGELDYAAVLKGGVSVVKRRIDHAQHPAGRLFWWFRSRTDLRANRYTVLNNRSGGSLTDVPGSFYNSVSLTIAGQVRELERAPFVWRDVVSHAKEEIDSGLEIGVYDWTRGWTTDDARSLQIENKAGKQPDGSINFTTADRPTLLFNLARTSPADTELRIVVLGWAQFQAAGGRGGLLAAN